MPGSIDVSTIVVVGSRPSGAANNIMAMWLMLDLVTRDPRQVIIAQPRTGEVEGHTITVMPAPGEGDEKPTLMQTQIDALRDAFERVGEVIADLEDGAVYQVGNVTITGAELKAAYFALTTIEVNNNIYDSGYSGENHGHTLYINLTAVIDYSGWGDPGMSYLMLHEMVHNS